MGAPVCLINPNLPAPSAPIVLMPSIPIANADNIVAVVNAIRAALNTITGQSTFTGTANTSSTPGLALGAFSQPPNTTSTGKNQQNGFIQTSQVVSQVTIKDPSSGATVVVNQITALTMTDSVTGQSWTWQAPTGLNTSPGS